MNINKKVENVIPFALTMGMKMPTDPRHAVTKFVTALRGHYRQEWCVFREYGDKRQNAYSAASYLRSRYKDIDWQAQRYEFPVGKYHYRVLAMVKKPRTTHNKENDMKAINPINIEVAAIREAWKPSKSVGIEFVGTDAPASYGVARNKYSKMIAGIVSNSPQWGIMYQSENNQYCHARKHSFVKRWGKRADGSPYMEFVVFKRANGMWAVAARLPYENVL